jgi:uncharacterized protein YecE (DUF72 family)
MKNVYIGCSGYSYHHWQNGAFYPPKTGDLLQYYADHFNTLEINASFYNIPKPDSVERWGAKMHANSKLVLKSPKSFTHSRQLKLHSDGDTRDGIELMKYFVEGIHKIDVNKRGPVLVQLAERSSSKLLDRVGPLAEFLNSSGLKLALEVRNTSWLVRETYDELKRHNAVLVASDRFTETDPTDTADFVYIRRHGPKTSGKYWGNYTDQDLKNDAAMIRRLAEAGKEVYIFFNNDGRAHAPHNAQTLMHLLGVLPPGSKHESLLQQVNALR